MKDVVDLNKISVEDLRSELRARAAREKGVAVPFSAASGKLREFDTATILKTLTVNQKVIYGTDDRKDIFELPAGPDLDDVDVVVALFDASDIMDNGDGTSTLRTQNFGDARGLCSQERFREQPIGAFCSGFLVAPDVIATAGHCVNAGNVTTVRFVFGFRMRDKTSAETVVKNAEIYSGASMIGREEIGTGADWALVRLDRPVSNHRIA